MNYSTKDFAEKKGPFEGATRLNELWKSRVKRAIPYLVVTAVLGSIGSMLWNTQNERLGKLSLSPETFADFPNKEIYVSRGDILRDYSECMEALGASNTGDNKLAYVEEVGRRNNFTKEGKIEGYISVPDC